MKTAEVIVEQRNWQRESNKITPNKLVYVRVAFGEVQIGRMVKAAGGHWDGEKKPWRLPYREVMAIGLENRMQQNKSIL